MDKIEENSRPLDEAIYAQVLERLEGIYCCLERHLIQPALVLLYSAIDSMAWLNMPEGQERVTRTDFKLWVDNYMANPGQHLLKMVTFRENIELNLPKLACSASDLYSARCGFVHSWTAESSLVVEGKAKRLYYASGDVDLEEELQKIKPELRAGLILIHVETLVEVFRQAVEFFRNDIRRDGALRRRVEERARYFLFSSEI